MAIENIDMTDAAWYSKFNSNFQKLLDLPFPMKTYADVSALTTAKNPKMYKNCFALIGGVIYSSDGTAWELFRGLDYIAPWNMYLPEGTVTTLATTVSAYYAACFDGTDYFCLELYTQADRYVDQHNSAGTRLARTALPTNFSASDICWDGTYFWIGEFAGTASKVYRYTSALADDGFSFSVGNSARGLTFDGTNLHVLTDSDLLVTEYTTAGVATGSSFPVLFSDHLEYGNGEFFVFGAFGESLARYTSAGVADGRYTITGKDAAVYVASGSLQILEGATSNKFHEVTKQADPVVVDIKTDYNNLLADLRSKNWILT